MNDVADLRSAIPDAQSELRTSGSIAQLAAALTKAQGEMPMPDKDREVTVRPKEGAAYKFSYATLDNIVATVRPSLAANGLAVLQPIVSVNGKPHLATRLLHNSGEWMESLIAVPADLSRLQAFGSALSYLRRYTYTALLGIVSDDDDDANEASGNTVTERRDREPQRRPAPPSTGSMREHAQSLPARTGAVPAADPDQKLMMRLPGGEMETIRAKNGKPVDEVWSNWVAYYIRGAPNAAELRKWWDSNSEFLPHVRSLFPRAAQAAMDAYNQAVSVKEPAQ